MLCIDYIFDTTLENFFYNFQYFFDYYNDKNLLYFDFYISVKNVLI